MSRCSSAIRIREASPMSTKSCANAGRSRTSNASSVRARSSGASNNRRSSRPPMRTPAVVAVLLGATAVAFAQAPAEKGRLGLSLAEIVRPWTGDLDAMVARRLVRVLTTYSKTQYFIDNGTPRGTAYDQGRLFEEALNAKI